jgi:LPXTG-site transpeptidase (sortase) family protein
MVDLSVATRDEADELGDADVFGDETLGVEASTSAKKTRRTVGLTLITIGLAFVLFLAYLFVFTDLQQQRKQRQLLNVFTTRQGAVVLSGALPHQGDPVAILTVPAIHLDQVVVQGTSPIDLEAGPGAMPQTARLGTKGNAVIAGRRYSAGAPFGHLTSLRVGNKIRVVNGLGAFTYVVTETAHVARPGSLDPVSPTKAARLTLVTSSSMTGSGRTYVVAKLVSSPAAAKRPKTPPTATELGITGQSSAVLATVLWGIILAMVLGASIVAYQRAGRRVLMIYALSTPIVLATALMFYSHLYLLLPSTI